MNKILKGLVLAGGVSRRLGTDKRRVPWRGKSLLGNAVDLAGKCCAEVLISGAGIDEGLNARALPDVLTGVGPIAGVITGLRKLQCPLLVLACDMPLLDVRTLERLIAGWEERPEDKVMTTFQQAETGYIQALAAIYEPAAEALLSGAVEGGVFSLNRAIPPDKRHHLMYSGAEAKVFFNLNHPEDLEQLEQLGKTEQFRSSGEMEEQG